MYFAQSITVSGVYAIRTG